MLAAVPALAQRKFESTTPSVRTRCAALLSALQQGLSADNASQLRELRDCDEYSGAFLAQLWSSRGKSVAVLNELLGASADVRDARTARAARAVVEDETRPLFERAAALTALVNYLEPYYLGVVEQRGERTLVSTVPFTHARSWVAGSQDVGESQRAEIVALMEQLRSDDTPRMLREIALIARPLKEK
jgi:hypothetical protein